MRDLTAAGFCHCDVKPDNIVPGTDRSCLIDVGLALRVGAYLNGFIRGTPMYVNPIILLCARVGVDLRMEAIYDYFSLGLVLVFMLSQGADFVVSEAAYIAEQVQWYDLPWAVGVKLLKTLLQPHIEAVCEEYLQLLQQQGVQRSGEVVIAGLFRMVVGLLLRVGRQQWSHQKVKRVVAAMGVQ
jgi:hypothetical protein